jgi:aspartyl-tRNA(Asn)/glutamyl-tRNA(Gln) amidotransferase subunit B
MSIKYEAVIGLEIHIQLNTLSKAFNADRNAFTDQANVNIGPITLGHPGTLPFANKKHYEKALSLAVICNSNIASVHYFDRKQYFYPDLPKGYQLTQDSSPYCTGGKISFYSNGWLKSIRLHHIHMEEDAGKLVHSNEKYSTVDYNRSGVALLEVVTEPDFRSSEEVHDFLTELQRIVRYLDISDGHMEEGSLRCDCNVSLRHKGSVEYGERCEIKNQNSKKFARSAIDAEIRRQTSILESGQKVQRATLLYDTVSDITRPMRMKESANDYRYFKDPDLPPMRPTLHILDEIKRNRKKMPSEWITTLINDYGMLYADADVLVDNPGHIEYFGYLISTIGYSKELAEITIHKIIPFLRKTELSFETFVNPDQMRDVVNLLQNSKVSKSASLGQVIPRWLENTSMDPFSIAKELNLVQREENPEIEPIVHQVFETFPEKVKEYKNGKKGLIGFFMGQTKAKLTHAVDPKLMQSTIEKLLHE